MHDELIRLADEYWDGLMAAYPTSATLLGDRRFDDRIEDFSAEVDRYVAIPGQAVAYKVGQLEIQRLRRQAEARQGDAFDIKAFHDTVLGSGSVSLPALRELVAP